MHSVAKYQKTRKRDSFDTLKNFSKKSRTVPKKIKRGDPLASAGFAGYIKKVKNERGDSRRQKIFKKSLTVPKKTERGIIWDFSKSILSKNIKKLKVGPLGEKLFSKKKSQNRKYPLAPLSFLNDIKGISSGITVF